MGFELIEQRVLLRPQSWPFMPRIKYAFKNDFRPQDHAINVNDSGTK